MSKLTNLVAFIALMTTLFFFLTIGSVIDVIDDIVKDGIASNSIPGIVVVSNVMTLYTVVFSAGFFIMSLIILRISIKLKGFSREAQLFITLKEYASTLFAMLSALGILYVICLIGDLFIPGYGFDSNYIVYDTVFFVAFYLKNIAFFIVLMGVLFIISSNIWIRLARLDKIEG